MRLVRFERVQQLDTDLETAWAFMSDPANLARITPPDLGFTLASPLPHRMHAGMIAGYTVTPFGWPRFTWITEITHVVEPVMFVDEQRFGPYRFWHHQHHFKEREGVVEMRDVVHYVLPFAPFSIPLSGMVARRLAHIFDYRHRELTTIFGGRS